MRQLILFLAVLSFSSSASASVWMTPSEIAALPITGAAYSSVLSAANATWVTPDLKNQDVKHGVSVLAAALIYARTGNPTLRAKARDGIAAAKLTMDDPSDYTTTNGALSLGRQLGAYVAAADLIDLASFDPAFDATFRSWLTTIRETTIGVHGAWSSLRGTSENSPNNWGAYARASMVAADAYLNDVASLDRQVALFRSYLGERPLYPSGAPWPSGGASYFPASNPLDYSCEPANWVGVNPSTCSKDGHSLSGAIVQDIIRSAYSWPPGSSGTSYSWEVLSAAYFEAEVLRHQGYDPYAWSGAALLRAAEFMYSFSATGDITGVAGYVPYIVNARYGTVLPVSATLQQGRIVGYTNWTHATGGVAPPSDTEAPASVATLTVH